MTQFALSVAAIFSWRLLCGARKGAMLHTTAPLVDSEGPGLAGSVPRACDPAAWWEHPALISHRAIPAHLVRTGCGKGRLWALCFNRASLDRAAALGLPTRRELTAIPVLGGLHHRYAFPSAGPAPPP
jgi:hypothetical protein